MATTYRLDHRPGAHERRRRSVALVALSLTYALVQLDATIVNVALPTLRDHLGGGVGVAQWVIDGYAVPFAAGMLTAGALGDRYGHRRTCVLGFGLFGLASVAAALAGDWPLLIGARVVQGVGAATMLPASLAMITELYPEPRERSRALGIWGGVATLGFAAGPLLGGVLITVSSWPAIFWINVPVAVLVGIVIALLGPVERPRRRGLHPLGTVLGVVALACLAGGIIEYGEGGVVLGSLVLLAALVTGAAFAWVERHGRHPLVPADLLTSPPFRWSLATGFLFNFAMYGALLCVSLALQGRFGLSALATGLAMLPMALVVSIGATASGFVAAVTGPRRPMLAGFACAGLGALVIATGALTSSTALVIGGLAGIGLCALAMPAMTSVALDAAPAQHAGLGSGSLNTARQIGGAVGVATLGAVLNAGGEREGFAVALAIAAVGCLAGLVSTVEATARREPR